MKKRLTTTLFAPFTRLSVQRLRVGMGGWWGRVEEVQEIKDKHEVGMKETVRGKKLEENMGKRRKKRKGSRKRYW